jgi:hypothetical protein
VVSVWRVVFCDVQLQLYSRVTWSSEKIPLLPPQLKPPIWKGGAHKNQFVQSTLVVLLHSNVENN